MEPVNLVLVKVKERIATRRQPPEATYRLQFHAGFTFRDAQRIAPYLAELGITHCYASPYLKARPGSTHGYDIVDHNCLNPEIGSEDDYRAWIESLHERNLGQIIDVVPNHMGVATNDNAWWNDVLENGPASRFAGHFDIAWRASPRPELQDKVLLPTLGEPYGDVLEAGQLRLTFEGGALFIDYFDRRFPVAPRSYAKVLGHRLEELAERLGPADAVLAEYQSILTAIRNIPDRTQTDPESVAERARETQVVKRRLAALVSDSPEVRTLLDENVAQFNGAAGGPHRFDLLDDLIEHQCYRLSDWRVASDEINYRRFFDINDLAALRMEREDVFAAAHALVLRLTAEGSVDGLRIDHPDGLYDPRQYFQRLQRHFVLACARAAVATEVELQSTDWKDLEGPLGERLAEMAETASDESWRRPLYVVAEKILGAAETLVDQWPVHGTSGYDFLNLTNGLFVDVASEAAFTRAYRDWIDDDTRYSELVYEKKRLILEVSLASELHMLTHQLDRLAQKNRRSRDFTFNTLRRALGEIIACFPVYRSYVDDNGASQTDRRHIELAVRRAAARNPLLSRRVFHFIRDMLLLQRSETFAEEDRAEQRRFAGTFQQVTAPVTAKGVEDTAFYVYHRLVSLNEVGGDPNRFGVASDALHRYCAERLAKWPFALSPLSTHDTKRSEDVRARLNVLSEMPDEWRAAVARWGELNAAHRVQVEDLVAPDANEEYLFYQALVGAWPLEPHWPDEYEAFVKRVQDYMTKALHEAKIHSSWINPNPDYDRAVSQFVARVLDPSVSGAFLDDFRAFQRRVSDWGLYNSLSQTLLKIAAPGVPDTYQGTELWDFSLVDPDNRRPVDYELRRTMLDELRDALAAGADAADLARSLLDAKEDGRAKLYLTWRALCCRRDNAGLFSEGDYLPLTAMGSKQQHVFGFARRKADRWAAAAVPRLLTRLMPDSETPPLGSEVWDDTKLLLADIDPTVRWHNVLTVVPIAPVLQAGQASFAAADLFAHFPVALLLGE